MILKALYDYYHRSDNLAPAGLEYKEIAFFIVIDENGNFIRIEDRRIDKKRSNSFLVIKGTRSGTIPKPYLFWDNVEYVLNYTKFHEPLNVEESKNSKLAKEQIDSINKTSAKHQALIQKWRGLSERFPAEKEFRAVALFYEKDMLSLVKRSPLWDEIKKKPTVNISFMLHGALRPVAENQVLHQLLELNKDEEDMLRRVVCLVTGNRGGVVESSTPTAIPGAQATARLGAFQVNSGYDSYGKSKGNNAPVSSEAEASYTTALNKLLERNSKNKFLIGNRKFLYWASLKGESAKAVEDGLFLLYNYEDTNEDVQKR